VKLDPIAGKEKRAFNVELWETFQIESEKKQRAAAKPSATKTPKTDADDEAIAREEHEKFQRALYRWKLTQLQRLIVERFESVKGPIDQQNVPFPEIVQLHLLWFACHGDAKMANARSEDLAESVSEAGGKAVRHGAQLINPVSIFETLDTIAAGRKNRDKVFRAVGLCLANWWSADFEGPRRGVTPEAIEWAAGQFGFDVCDPWKLTKAFLDLHSLDQLREQAKEWKYMIKNGLVGRDALAAEMLRHCTRKPAPKSITKLKAVQL